MLKILILSDQGNQIVLCKFKSKCKFNHPKDMVNALGTGTNNESLIADSAVLPVRPSEPICVFYAKTGKCKFGAICKFNHPKDIKTSPLIAKETIYTATTDAADAPTEACNAKGLPIRQGEVDCSFYMKTAANMVLFVASTILIGQGQLRI
ncbi:Zinc finger CCCH domain-containing protein 37 [Zea mays]|uniref:Zinc finger CCCH domain-containing protein 37 n=1 Tax=Zea mays TaxID=4577 RepID=A0A1D6FZC9_MAIZE|nr:Zinc finger CCCH domain-containing protein 37 [Zea mays]